MASTADDKVMNSKGNLMTQQLEDKEIQEILKSGTDLRQYSQQIEKDLKAVENQSIDEYIKESQNIACLHNQIGDCDGILERMESMLTNFQVWVHWPKTEGYFQYVQWFALTVHHFPQSILSNISSEITTLQKKSVSMSVQLTNRQSVRAQLSQFIEDMAIPEEMIKWVHFCCFALNFSTNFLLMFRFNDLVLSCKHR